MGKRRLLLVGLVAIVVLSCLFVAACGGGDESDETTTTLDPVTVMRDALVVVEADVVGLTDSVTSGDATGADLKEALAAAEPHWQAVVDASEGVGADPTEAQELWDDLATAVDALPDDAGMTEMMSVAGPAMAIQNHIAALWLQVGGSGGDVTTTIAPSTTTTVPGVIDWSDAAEYVGTEVTITGTVTSCDCEDDIQRVYLDLGGDESGSDFSIMIDLNPDGSVPFLGLKSENLPSLVGKTVEITGTVVSAGANSYGIFLTDVSQLVVK